MIIACPACATRYVVPDSAIGAGGRTVRCAKCRHSWFEDGRGAVAEAGEDTMAAPGAPRPAAAGQPSPRAAAAAPADEPGEVPISERRTVFAPQGYAGGGDGMSPEPQPLAAETAEETASAYDPEPALAGDAYLGSEDEARPARRSASRLWVAAAVAFAVLVAALVGAVSVWGMPDWVPLRGPTFAQAQPDLVLEFPPERQDRRTLANGTEFFGASGSVTNIGGETRRVPPILIVLRDAGDRIVYTWEVTSPKAVLAPGESVTINEAVTDVPRSAKVAEIGWKPS
jgi:predicted Zn finger-like uncharacterized protein